MKSNNILITEDRIVFYYNFHWNIYIQILHVIKMSINSMNIDDEVYYTSYDEIKTAKFNRKTDIIYVEFRYWTDSESRPRLAVIKKQEKKSENPEHEAEFLKRCNEIDENTVKYYYHYTDNRYIYIVMEYCKRGSLKKNIGELKKKSKRLAENELIQIFIDLSTIVSNLHYHNVFHRDIKPDNIFITGSEKFKLGDMGESKGKKEEKNTVKGTVCYFSPHLYSLYISCKLSKDAIHRFSDLNPEAEDNYSLGKTFLELAVQEVYIDFNSLNSAQIREAANKRLEYYGYSPLLNEIILDMLEDTTTTQYSIDDFLIRFKDLLESTPSNKTLHFESGSPELTIIPPEQGIIEKTNNSGFSTHGHYDEPCETLNKNNKEIEKEVIIPPQSTDAKSINNNDAIEGSNNSEFF